MDSLLNKNIQDILNGQIEASNHLKKLLQKENKNELQDQLSTLDFGALPVPPGYTSLPETSQTLPPEISQSLRETAEAVIELCLRPVLFIRNDTFVIDPVSMKYLNSSWVEKLEKGRKIIEPAIKAVGRIEVLNREPYVGTGWLVTPDILVTNRHVAKIFANGLDDKKFSFKPNCQEVYIDFKVEDEGLDNFKAENDNKNQARFQIKNILYIENVYSPESIIFPDIAFLQVSDRGDSAIPLPAPIPLSENPVMIGRDVAVIGYPGYNANQQKEIRGKLDLLGQLEYLQILRNTYELKRLQLGELIYHSSGKKDGRIAHDCTTLKGNSGSVVLDLETGEAVGIHFSGDNKANYAVPAAIIKECLDKIC